MKKRNLILLSLITLGAMSISVIGASALKEIKAYVKSDLAYTLNGKSVLEGKGGLVYEDKVYVPLRDVAETLGVSVDYKNNTVSLTQTPVSEIAVEEENPEDVQVATMKGVVTAVEDTTFTLKVNEEDYIVHTSKDTLFAHIKNKRAYTFEDIEVGQNLQIATDGTVMTSLPPQVGALAITFLD